MHTANTTAPTRRSSAAPALQLGLGLGFGILMMVGCGEPTPSEGEDSGGLDTALDADPCATTEPADASPLSLPGDAACGATIWADHCAGCHGDAGLGGDEGPALDEHVPAHTDEELVFVVVAGRGDMPALGLENQEVAHVLAWMRDSFGPYDGVGH